MDACRSAKSVDDFVIAVRQLARDVLLLKLYLRGLV